MNHQSLIIVDQLMIFAMIYAIGLVYHFPNFQNSKFQNFKVPEFQNFDVYIPKTLLVLIETLIQRLLDGLHHNGKFDPPLASGSSSSSSASSCHAGEDPDKPPQSSEQSAPICDAATEPSAPICDSFDELISPEPSAPICEPHAHQPKAKGRPPGAKNKPKSACAGIPRTPGYNPYPSWHALGIPRTPEGNPRPTKRTCAAWPPAGSSAGACSSTDPATTIMDDSGMGHAGSSGWHGDWQDWQDHGQGWQEHHEWQHHLQDHGQYGWQDHGQYGWQHRGWQDHGYEPHDGGWHDHENEPYPPPPYDRWHDDGDDGEHADET